MIQQFSGKVKGHLWGEGWKSIISAYFFIFLISLVLAPPANFAENLTVREDPDDWHYYEVVASQIERIGPLDYPPASHEKKRETRLLVPVLFKALPFAHGPHLPVFLWIFHWICHFLLFLQIVVFQREKLPGLHPPWLLAACMAFIWPCQMLLGDFGPTFDGVAILLLVAGLNRRSDVACVAALLLAMTVDERSLFPALAILCFRQIGREGWMRPFASGACLFALYALYRMFLTHRYGITPLFHVSDDVRPFMFVTANNIYLFVIATLNLYKGLYLLLFPAAWILLRSPSEAVGPARNWLWLGCIAVLTGMIGGVSLSVADFTRSLAYSFPVVLFGLAGLPKSVLANSTVFWMIAGFNLITPTMGYNSGESVHFSVNLFSKIAARIHTLF